MEAEFWDCSVQNDCDIISKLIYSSVTDPIQK